MEWLTEKCQQSTNVITRRYQQVKYIYIKKRFCKFIRAPLPIWKLSAIIIVLCEPKALPEMAKTRMQTKYCKAVPSGTVVLHYKCRNFRFRQCPLHWSLEEWFDIFLLLPWHFHYSKWVSGLCGLLESIYQ